MRVLQSAGEGIKRMARIVKKSTLPIYLIALVWLVWGLFLSLYQVTDYVEAAIVSVIVFLVAKAVCKDKVYDTPEPEPEPEPEPVPETTGNPELDALIKERDRAVSEMRRLNDNIQDETISRQIDHLETVTRQIIAQVVAEPKKLPQIRKFLNYYLPTTLKLLNAYDRMAAVGISGENIDTTKGKIETMMQNVVHAFDKQLDALFGDEALDISTDITVLENMLSREGLGGLQM